MAVRLDATINVPVASADKRMLTVVAEANDRTPAAQARKYIREGLKRETPRKKAA